MNKMYGIRVRKAFVSEENWYAINHYGGKKFSHSGIVLIIIGLISFFIPFGSNDALIILFALAPVIVLIMPVLQIIKFSQLLRVVSENKAYQQPF